MKIDIENYLHGSCHLFALALHKELGYPMKFFWDMESVTEDWEVIGRALVHAFCETKDKKHIIDARGFTNMETIEEEFEWNIPSIEDYTVEELKEDMKSGLLHQPEAGEIDMLRAYIRENISKYN